MRAAGIRITLDNFGTGYSSLYHLRNFKLDKIKIDRSFIQAMATDAESASIVNALVGLGRGLGLTVAADGIDDHTADHAVSSGNGHRSACQWEERIHQVRMQFAPQPGVHAAHGGSHHQAKMVDA